MRWYHVLHSSTVGWTTPEYLTDIRTQNEARELAELEASIETESIMLSAGIDTVLILMDWDGTDLNQVGSPEDVMHKYRGYFVRYNYDDLFKSQDLEEINAGASAQAASRKQTEHEQKRRRPADDDTVELEKLLSQRELLRTLREQKRAAKQQAREARRDARLDRRLARAERKVDRFCTRLESFGYALDVLDDFLNS